jgi:hypothetical protein
MSVLVATAITAFVTVGRAETRTYALIMGNNTPPSEQAGMLSLLHYADDDAVRFYRFFKHITADVRLFTVPDAETQLRFQGITAEAEVPTIAAVRQAAVKLGAQIEGNRKKGDKTVVYIVFSGHGSYTESGEPALVLLDGLMTQAVLYQDILGKLNADYQHLFIDACYAEGVVGTRGLFNREVDARQVSINSAEKNAVIGPASSQFPGLGVVVSSSADKETHEWSKIESGVFTHELLSGLAGPADINRDGKIVYSELFAFITAANRGITDARGKLDVIARPPEKNQDAPIVDLTSFGNISFLQGDPSSLHHFVIELDTGERYLEANLGSMTYAHIALPGSGTAYLRTKDLEARLNLSQGMLLNFSDLRFKKYETQSKGSIETALSKGLFIAPYGVEYYQGFIDKSGLYAVSMDAPPLVLNTQYKPSSDKTDRTKKALAISAFTLAGVAAGAAVTCGALSLSAKNDFQETDLQRSAEDANQRYVAFGNATWIAAAFVPIGLVAGFLLRPHKPKKQKTSNVGFDLLPATDSIMLNVTF